MWEWPATLTEEDELSGTTCHAQTTVELVSALPLLLYYMEENEISPCPIVKTET